MLNKVGIDAPSLSTTAPPLFNFPQLAGLDLQAQMQSIWPYAFYQEPNNG